MVHKIKNTFANLLAAKGNPEINQHKFYVHEGKGPNKGYILLFDSIIIRNNYLRSGLIYKTQIKI